MLHYVADTEPGSSGSPVFNNEWQVIALHHWGGPWRQTRDDAGVPLATEINEGIRTSAIVRELKARAGGLSAAERALLETALAPESIRPPDLPGPRDGRVPGLEPVRLESDGTAVWRLPLEISVRLPVGAATGGAGVGGPAAGGAAAGPARTDDPLAPERTVHIDLPYDNRPGFRPAFLGATHRIELPRLSAAQKAKAARNLEAEPGDDPFELRYQHFSVVLNKKRRLAFFTACNVDGRSSKDVNRKTGAVSPRRPAGGGEAAEGAEASERWFLDDRVAPEAQTNQELYDSQEVPGFPNKRTKAWQDRMFQRGHLVRRADPAWGTDERAVRADADTFHFANCTPQVGFFNMGSAPAGTPNSGGGRLWRAIEDHVLDNAVDEQKRASVFTGPVLDDERDVPWRQDVIPGFRVPLRFWKIVVWVESGKLRALAMLADQEPVIEVMPEALERGEAFADTSKVRDFVVTVGEVERLTGLTFDDTVRAADVNAGEARRGARGEAKRRGAKRRAVKSFEEIGLFGS